MKFESFLLRGLFVICMLACIGTLGTMLLGPSPRSAAALTETAMGHAPVQTSAIAPLACPLIADGVLCVSPN